MVTVLELIMTSIEPRSAILSEEVDASMLSVVLASVVLAMRLESVGLAEREDAVIVDTVGASVVIETENKSIATALGLKLVVEALVLESAVRTFELDSAIELLGLEPPVRMSELASAIGLLKLEAAVRTFEFDSATELLEPDAMINALEPEFVTDALEPTSVANMLELIPDVETLGLMSAIEMKPESVAKLLGVMAETVTLRLFKPKSAIVTLAMEFVLAISVPEFVVKLLPGVVPVVAELSYVEAEIEDKSVLPTIGVASVVLGSKPDIVLLCGEPRSMILTIELRSVTLVDEPVYDVLAGILETKFVVGELALKVPALELLISRLPVELGFAVFAAKPTCEELAEETTFVKLADPLFSEALAFAPIPDVLVLSDALALTVALLSGVLAVPLAPDAFADGLAPNVLTVELISDALSDALADALALDIFASVLKGVLTALASEGVCIDELDSARVVEIVAVVIAAGFKFSIVLSVDSVPSKEPGDEIVVTVVVDEPDATSLRADDEVITAVLEMESVRVAIVLGSCVVVGEDDCNIEVSELDSITAVERMFRMVEAEEPKRTNELESEIAPEETVRSISVVESELVVAGLADRASVVLVVDGISAIVTAKETSVEVVKKFTKGVDDSAEGLNVSAKTEDSTEAAKETTEAVSESAEVAEETTEAVNEFAEMIGDSTEAINDPEAAVTGLPEVASDAVEIIKDTSEFGNDSPEAVGVLIDKVESGPVVISIELESSGDEPRSVMTGESSETVL
ncbi:hypothetical protein NX059_005489 [Plenodomus lindquistii]|nr:hypothetical protein NX059_005489 [Plenodomus lindquistii]